MSWTHYRLVFRLESPLHIGWRKAGNLMQTRRYVPGKNLWAALTERLVWLAGQGSDPKAYQCVGEALKRCFRFGYLWPTYEGRTDVWQPHFPWDEPQGPEYWDYLGKAPPLTHLRDKRDEPQGSEYWDYLYLDGTARTALASERRTAAEGMLYEIEFIAPYTREGKPVYLVGDLWVRHNLPSEIDHNGATIPLPWEQALQRLQIGGERGYGWGRIQLACCRRSENSTTTSGYAWTCDGGEVCLTVPGQKRLTAHAHAVGDQALPAISGPVEPLTGWERQGNRDVGWRLAHTEVLYVPGGVTVGEITVRVQPYGRWSLCRHTPAEEDSGDQ